MKLYIDDVRPLPENFDILVRDVFCAKELITHCDIHHVSFDHDLGREETGYDLAKWIEEQAYYGEIQKMSWEIHSANPVGYKNIQTAMINADNYWSDRHSSSDDFYTE